MLRTAAVMIAIVALSLAAAAPASAARHCKGKVQTSQPNGGLTAKHIRAVHTTCRVARSVARHWTGVAGSRPKDRKGHKWTYKIGRLLPRGIRNIFVRHGKKVSCVTGG